MDGVRMLFGAELNIMDPEGNVDLPERVCEELDLAIASMHIPCFGEGRSEDEVMRLMKRDEEAVCEDHRASG